MDGYNPPIGRIFFSFYKTYFISLLTINDCQMVFFFTYIHIHIDFFKHMNYMKPIYFISFIAKLESPSSFFFSFITLLSSINSLIYSYLFSSINTLVYSYQMHTHTHAHMYAQIYMDTLKHTHIHKHTHMQTHTQSLSMRY